ncbi:uncharacterized protein LOC144248296 [Lonchura striata]
MQKRSGRTLGRCFGQWDMFHSDIPAARASTPPEQSTQPWFDSAPVDPQRQPRRAAEGIWCRWRVTVSSLHVQEQCFIQTSSLGEKAQSTAGLQDSVPPLPERCSRSR